MFRFDPALADATDALRSAARPATGAPRWRRCGSWAGRPGRGSGGSVEAGIGHMRAALALAEQLGDRGAEAELLGWLAVLSSNQLRFVEALAYGRRAAGGGARCRSRRSRPPSTG